MSVLNGRTSKMNKRSHYQSLNKRKLLQLPAQIKINIQVGICPDQDKKVHMGQRSYDFKGQKISSNDSRKKFHDAHEEFICNSGLSPISAYEAETSHDSNKEFNDSLQEFITTQEHSSNLNYDEARTSYDSTRS